MPCFPCVFLWSSTEVRNTPVDALLLPSADAQSNPRYRAMLTDLRTRIGFSSSVACADWTLPGQQVIPGNDGDNPWEKPMGKRGNWWVEDLWEIWWLEKPWGVLRLLWSCIHFREMGTSCGTMGKDRQTLTSTKWCLRVIACYSYRL